MSLPRRPLQPQHLKEVNNKCLIEILPAHCPQSDRPSVCRKSTTYSRPEFAHWAHCVWHHGDSGRIYLGPRQAARALPSAFKAAGITAVVNVSPQIPCYHRTNKLKYCQVAVWDTPSDDLLSYFPSVTAFIHAILTKGESVLVHCQAGSSRSATIVLAYLMRYCDMSRDQAYLHVKERRSQINPNDGFWYQLAAWENQLKGRVALLETSHATLLSNHHVDKEWAGTSCREYAIWRDASPDQTKPCFQALRNTTIPQETFLVIALDFVWGRGVLAVEVDWLVQVCRILDDVHTNDETNKQTSQEIIRRQLTDVTSDFHKRWPGKVFPGRVERLLQGFSTHEGNKVHSPHK